MKGIKNKIKIYLAVVYYLLRHPARFWRAFGEIPRRSLGSVPRLGLGKLGKIARWCWATLPRRIVSSILIATFVITPISFLLFKKEAKAAWWDDSWQYRQKIQLTNSTGADLEDFQVSTTVDTASLITAGKMQATTCADMRFTDSKGQQLDYWIEENNPGCNNAATKVWIKAPKVYNGTNATSIYMYYGNPSAAETQDGEKVFEFFDDFNGSEIDTAKWTEHIMGTGGTITETGGEAILDPANDDDSSASIRSKTEFTNNVVMEVRRKQATQGFFMGFSLGSGNIEDYNGNQSEWRRTTLANGYYWNFYGSGAGSNGIYRMPASGGYVSINNGAFTLDSSSYKVHKYTYSSSGALDWSIDGISVRSGTDSNFLSDNKRMLVSQGEFDLTGSTQYLDYIFVRKYASADPTTSASAEEIGPGPVAYWKFDEGQGDTTQDATVNNNDGNLQNSPTWKQDSDCVSGKCLEFNGTDQYVSVDDDDAILDFDASKEYTWSAWINYSGFPAEQTTQCFLSKDPPPMSKETGFNLCLRQNGSVADFYVNYGSTDSNDLSLGLPSNNWTHIEIEYDGASSWKTYINGIYKGSISFSVSSDTSAKYFIGAACQGATDGVQNPALFFKGKIDSVKIFPYQRSADQIKQDYNAGLAGQATSSGSAAAVGESPKWMTDGLVGHWKMDETSGTVVADSSGNGNTGTLTNAQETGTSDASENTVTTMIDTDGSLSTTDDAYNNMILRFTAACGSITSGTERTITDYTGTPHTFTVATLADIPNTCAYEIRHQTGGKFGNGLGFGGNPYDTANDYVDVGDKTAFNSNTLTISLWMKTNQTWEGILSKGTAPGWSARGYNISVGNGHVYWNIVDSSNNYHTIISPNTYNDNNWHFITATVDTKGMRLYVDGASVGSNPQNSYSYSSGYSLIFGKRNGSPGNPNGFSGLLDDVRIYNRALSPDEVRSLSEWAPGPVGWWKMDEGSGGTINDSSGNGINGTIYNSPIWTNGKYGNGINFDKNNDYIEMPKDEKLNNELVSGITLEAWANFNSFTDSVYESIIGKPTGYDAGGCGRQFGLTGGYNDQRIRGFIDTTGGSLCQGLFSNSTINTGQWYHLTFSYDSVSGKANLYINGKVDSTTNYSGRIEPYPYTGGTYGGSPVQVGAYHGPTYGLFDGLLDDVRIYNYARTSKQITEDMNAGHPIGGSPVGSPVAHWKFDEGHDTTAEDSSQNGKDLTLSTSSAWTNSGKFGRAFDGADNRRVADGADDNDLDFAASDDFALTGWVKSDSNPAATQYILHKQTGYEGYAVYMETDGDIVFGIGDTSSGSFPEDTAGNAGRDFADGQWHHYAAVKTSNTRIDMYVDGELIGSDTTLAADGTLANSATLYLGDADAADGTNEFLGEIDEVKIYRAALTPEQVKLDMNQGKSVQFGGQTSATGATGAAAEYCVPGDTTSCAGPVGEWKFDEGSGGSANDTSGNGNAGTLGTDPNTPSWRVDGKYNNALSFDGTNDYINMGDPADGDLDVGTGDFTIEAWMYTNNPAGHQKIVSKGSTDSACDISGNKGYQIYTIGGKYRFKINTGGAQGCLQPDSTTSVTAGWHHLAAIADRNGNMYLYIDGKQDISTSMSALSDSLDNSNNFRVGNYSTSNYAPFNGKIDHVQLYKYARTPAQIAWDYNRGKPVGWWKMDEGEGKSAYDAAENSNTCTLANNYWETGKYNTALKNTASGGTHCSIIQSSILNPTDPNMSVGAWVYVDDYYDPGVNTWQTIVEGSGSLNQSSGYYLGFEGMGSNFTWRAGDGSGYYANIQVNETSIPLGQWVYVMGTLNSENAYLYVNGKLIGTDPHSMTSLVYGSYPIAIGTLSYGLGSHYLRGKIDDVRVYNYALTAEQVKQVMNEGSAIRFGE